MLDLTLYRSAKPSNLQELSILFESKNEEVIRDERDCYICIPIFVYIKESRMLS